MIFENISNDDFINLLSVNQGDRLVFMFIKDVNLESQLFLKLNPIALNILEIIKLCGGIIRRSDLIAIAFDGDKNIYTHIKDLEKYKLIKLDGERDSSICLTAIALSVLNRKKVKNGIRFDRGTYDKLEKSKFLLSLYTKDSLMLHNEFQALEHIVNIEFEAISRPDEGSISLFKKDVLKRYKDLVQANCYVMDDGKTVAIYATTKKEFLRKFNSLLDSKLNKRGFGLNVNKIIVPELKDLEDLHRNELILLHQEKPSLGNNFINVNIVSLDEVC